MIWVGYPIIYDEFYTSERWLGMGFLYHQQHQSSNFKVTGNDRRSLPFGWFGRNNFPVLKTNECPVKLNGWKMYFPIKRIAPFLGDIRSYIQGVIMGNFGGIRPSKCEFGAGDIMTPLFVFPLLWGVLFPSDLYQTNLQVVTSFGFSYIILIF